MIKSVQSITNYPKQDKDNSKNNQQATPKKAVYKPFIEALQELLEAANQSAA